MPTLRASWFQHRLRGILVQKIVQRTNPMQSLDLATKNIFKNPSRHLGRQNPTVLDLGKWRNYDAFWWWLPLHQQITSWNRVLGVATGNLWPPPSLERHFVWEALVRVLLGLGWLENIGHACWQQWGYNPNHISRWFAGGCCYCLRDLCWHGNVGRKMRWGQLLLRHFISAWRLWTSYLLVWNQLTRSCHRQMTWKEGNWERAKCIACLTLRCEGNLLRRPFFGRMWRP